MKFLVWVETRVMLWSPPQRQNVETSRSSVKEIEARDVRDACGKASGNGRMQVKAVQEYREPVTIERAPNVAEFRSY